MLKRYFAPETLVAELGGGEILYEGPWFVMVRRAGDRGGATALPVAGGAEARPGEAAARASRPATRSSRCRSSAGGGPACVPVRPGARASSRAPSGGRGAAAPGATLRRWLELDEEAFYATFYCASVTRCYPGKSASGRGDRTPTPARAAALRALARRRARAAAAAADRHGRRARALESCSASKSVTEFVGERYELGGAVAVPLPHPSGASGWLNAPANRERVDDALALVRAELARL